MYNSVREITKEGGAWWSFERGSEVAAGAYHFTATNTTLRRAYVFIVVLNSGMSDNVQSTTRCCIIVFYYKI